MRVGEVTKLALDPHDPRKVEALIALDRAVPVRADTKVALEFQGLTGLADVSLAGGAPDAAPVVAGAGGLPTIYADANAGADLTQAARTMLRASTAWWPKTKRQCAPRCTTSKR